MEPRSRIFIAGHQGMVGSALWRSLERKGYSHLIGRPFDRLDLRRQEATEQFFEEAQPEYVFLAAARVGGIMANDTYRAEFIYDNLMIQNNVIHAAYRHGVKKLLFLGSSCIYPRMASQPMKEEYLLTGPLEPTNEPYAIAKIAGIKMCENYYRQYGAAFISVMPTNLYGPNDNFHLATSHVLPALIRRFHLARCLEHDDWDALRHDLQQRPIHNTGGEAAEETIITTLQKEGIHRTENPEAPVTVTLWGTGAIYREFLHVDDMADACTFIMETVEAKTLYDTLQQTHINIGTGEDRTIQALATTVKEITGSNAHIVWDHTKPDGTPKKQLDVTLLHQLNWKHKIPLEKGIETVYQHYLAE